MKTKMLILSTAILIAVSCVIYGFTLKTEKCPLAGTPECPLIQNCPDKGTPDFKLIKGDCCSKK